MEIKINIVKLKNKSRNGLYLQVKCKSKPIRYYKFGLGQGQIDATKKYYEDKYIKNKSKGTYRKYVKAYHETLLGNPVKKPSEINSQAQRYIKKIQKKGSLNSQFKTGSKSAIIKNVLNTTTSEITQAKKNMIENLVLDKDLLNIILTDENFNKLKNRLDYEVFGKDNNGNVLIEANAHGKTLNQVKSEIKTALHNNVEVNKTKYRFLDYLKKLGWNGERRADGIISRVELKITFRKG